MRTNLWNWRGRIGPEPYTAWALTLAALKITLDWTIASTLFDRPWSPLDYMQAGTWSALLSYDWDTRVYLGTLLIFSLPFAWVGVMLTIRRLRSAALPLWLAIFFFLPVINLILFIALCVLPEQPNPQWNAPTPRRWWSPTALVPDNPYGSAAFAVFVTALLGWGFTVMGAEGFELYGVGLFVGLPFCLGVIASLIHGVHAPRAFQSCLAVSLGALGGVFTLMLVFALEGVICLIMAAPIWVGCTTVGAAAGYVIQAQRSEANWKRMLLIALFASPAMMGMERVFQPTPPLRYVVTEVVIDRPPEEVWPNVVAFPPLDEPDDWLFRAGVAYPMLARIEGTGVGAVRYCEFSTGPFVEPITIWDPPHKLAFDVTHNPSPMRELSFYDHVEPPHLHGFMVSQRGQFELIALPDGRTRLVGTTWYRNHMSPQVYWTLWSDHIIHRIHGNVLDHIAAVTNAEDRR